MRMDDIARPSPQPRLRKSLKADERHMLVVQIWAKGTSQLARWRDPLLKKTREFLACRDLPIHAKMTGEVPLPCAIRGLVAMRFQLLSFFVSFSARSPGKTHLLHALSQSEASLKNRGSKTEANLGLARRVIEKHTEPSRSSAEDHLKFVCSSVQDHRSSYEVLLNLARSTPEEGRKPLLNSLVPRRHALAGWRFFCSPMQGGRCECGPALASSTLT